MLLTQDRVSLWYYDASGIVTTSDVGLSVIQHFETLAAVLIAFACSDAERFGALTAVQLPEGRVFPDAFPFKTLTGCFIDLPPALVHQDDANDTKNDNQSIGQDGETNVDDQPGRTDPTDNLINQHTDVSTDEQQDGPNKTVTIPQELATTVDSTFSSTAPSESVPTGSSSDVRITLQEPLYSQYTLVGRRTFVYKACAAQAEGLKGKKLIVKFSYQVKTRQREQDMLRIARTSEKADHFPELHLAADIWSLSEGIRQRLTDRGAKGGFYEERLLRVLVFTEYKPLRSLFSQSSKYLGRMVYQMLDCECLFRSTSWLTMLILILSILQVFMTYDMARHECCIVTSVTITSCMRCGTVSPTSS